MTPKKQRKYKCACCGKKTLDSKECEICERCNWQSDAVQEDDPTFEGGANETSLNGARKRLLVREKLEEYINGKISLKELQEWEIEMWRKDFEPDDWEGDESFTNEVLHLIDMSDIDGLSIDKSKAIVKLLKLNETSKVLIGKLYKLEKMENKKKKAILPEMDGSELDIDLIGDFYHEESWLGQAIHHFFFYKGKKEDVQKQLVHMEEFLKKVKKSEMSKKKKEELIEYIGRMTKIARAIVNKDKIRDIFNKYDPAGIYFGKNENPDEYDSEIKQLLLRLKNIYNLSDMEKELMKILNDMFWKGMIKDKKRFDSLAKELYKLLCKQEVNLK